jgi:hypothetical protein
MNDIKSSIFCHAFNLTTYPFSVETALRNFCAFADEVVVATLPCADNSPELLKALEAQLPNLRVVVTDIKLTDNRFDGKLKTAALRATTHPIKIIADADERFVLSQKPLWQSWFKTLLKEEGLDGLMVPVIDLWGATAQIRGDRDIGQKFRVHKATVVERGVIAQAERGSGYYDTSMSDSTEPLLAGGSLAHFASIVPKMYLMPLFSRMLADVPYVVHHGYLSLESRAKINREFWKEAWEQRSGHPENVETEVGELRRVPTVDHGLPIE